MFHANSSTVYIVDYVFCLLEKELLTKVSRLEQECKVALFSICLFVCILWVCILAYHLLQI